MIIEFDSMFSFTYLKNTEFKDFNYHTCELVYFISGEGITIINNKEFPYYAGDICFTTPGDLKSNLSLKKTNYICLRFGILNTNNMLASGVYTMCPKDILAQFISIKKEYDKKQYNYRKICNLKVEEILIKLLRISSFENNDIYNIIKEIDRKKLLRQSVKQMAEKSSYSYDRFRHKFKEITGLSPIDYIINKRIEYACELLIQSNYNCTDISQLCGFSNSSQFSSIFKSKTGVNPNQYRKNN